MQAKDKVVKFLGMHSSKRFYSDWQVAQEYELITNNKESWPCLVQEPYKHTVKNFHFGTLTKGDQEFLSHLQSRGKERALRTANLDAEEDCSPRSNSDWCT